MKRNHLSGIIRWQEHPAAKRTLKDQRYANGVVDICAERTANFRCDDKALYFNEATGVMCAALGYITNAEELRTRYSLSHTTADVELIERLYSLKRLAFVPELEGIFLICLFDEHTHKVYLFQSEYGMNLPLYYTSTAEQVVFSTSLKRLLPHLASRALDLAAVRDFLFFENVIPNESTLIQDVYKFVPQTYLRIDFQTRSLTSAPLLVPQPAVSKAEAKRDLLACIQESTKRIFQQLRKKKLAVTLTAGWDTNLIVSFLRTWAADPISAVTIDGGGAHNEVPATADILQHYANQRSGAVEGSSMRITHLTGTLRDDIASLPDIVWILEGYLFQEGMFLRYELAKILAEKHCDCVFVGACADQILYPETLFRKIVRHLPETPLTDRAIRLFQRLKDRIRGTERLEERELRAIMSQNPFHVYSSTVRYNLDIDFLTKMHELMLNSFGIQGIYPFLDRKLASASRALGTLNKKKKFYKERVRDLLGPEITQHFKKSGSVVDTKRLFARNKELLLHVFDTALVKQMLTEDQIAAIRKQPEMYHVLVLQLVYLYLFHELFVSGAFDEQLNAPHLDIPLQKMLCM